MIMPWLDIIDEFSFLAKKLQGKNGRGRKMAKLLILKLR